MFGILASFVRPAFAATIASPMALQQPSNIFVRGLMKTHKGTAKRWRKTSTGYKRSQAGRNHGNAGWSKRSLRELNGKKPNHKTHLQRLRRLLPYNN